VGVESFQVLRPIEGPYLDPGIGHAPVPIRFAAAALGAHRNEA
jgi:hypothetical protein